MVMNIGEFKAEKSRTGATLSGLAGLRNTDLLPVYLGQGSGVDGKVHAGQGEYDRFAGPRPVQNQETTQLEAIDDFYHWSPEYQAAWGKQLYNAGLLKSPSDWDGMLQAWTYAVKQSARYYNAGKNMTPWDYMQQYMFKQAEQNQGPTTSTSTSVNLPSKEEADMTIKAIFKEQLGRAPEAGELSKYRSMLMQQAKANPNKTVTTTTTDKNGNTSSNSTTSGGFNPQGWLEDKAQGDPEWGAYQAATTYYNALVSAI